MLPRSLFRAIGIDAATKTPENASGEVHRSQPGEEARFDISPSSPPEQKLAFLEALGRHFIFEFGSLGLYWLKKY
ncbi:MAG: hypothetical protein IPL83_16330 [Bdellovibrionales bacterium]|nr:hypothetical protein [Bdellovibrionales bacterium]